MAKCSCGNTATTRVYDSRYNKEYAVCGACLTRINRKKNAKAYKEQDRRDACGN